MNEASRLESLSSKLGRTVILSEDVAKLVDQPTEELGSFDLKGVEGQRKAFGLKARR